MLKKVSSALFSAKKKLHKFPVPFLYIIQRETSTLTDEALLDITYPQKPPIYEKDIKVLKSPIENVKDTPSNINKILKRKEKPVLACKQPEFNHYKNQKYQKFLPVPLASKGWHHYKSKGDYFTIDICNEEDYVNNLFWQQDEISFTDLRLTENLVEALNSAGISQPTKIQVEGIPKLLTGKNCLITAETGCGKTLTFLLPAIQQVLNLRKSLKNRPLNTPLILILTPSRDLAQQIYKVAQPLLQKLPISCHVLIGGKTKQKMLNPHFQHTDILIASLGAMSKLTTTGIYDISEVRHLILDEADTLLDDSFNELLLRYLKKFKIRLKPDPDSLQPKNTQLTLVSATLPRSLYEILQDHVEVDSFLTISTPHIHKILPHVKQTFLRIGPIEKPHKILQLAKQAVKIKQPMIIFSNKSKTCDWLSMMLPENGVKVIQLNAGMPHHLRKHKFEEFQNGLVNILSCTDIASRGLDTVRAEHIVNYEFPIYMADYIHRCGRTGRVGSSRNCTITNFVSGKREIDLVQKIELAARMMDVLPNVNANITKIIRNKIQKSADVLTNK